MLAVRLIKSSGKIHNPSKVCGCIYQIVFKTGRQLPRESETTHQRARATITVKLNLYCHCHCHMPWRPSDNEVRGMAMAECEICLKWFHQKCEIIPDSIFRDGGSWTCNDCTARSWTTMTFHTHGPEETSVNSRLSMTSFKVYLNFILRFFLHKVVSLVRFCFFSVFSLEKHKIPNE